MVSLKSEAKFTFPAWVEVYVSTCVPLCESVCVHRSLCYIWGTCAGYVVCVHMHACYSAHVKVRGQLARVSSLLPPYGSPALVANNLTWPWVMILCVHTSNFRVLVFIYALRVWHSQRVNWNRSNCVNPQDDVVKAPISQRMKLQLEVLITSSPPAPSSLTTNISWAAQLCLGIFMPS